MEAAAWKSFVAQLSGGKRVGGHIYLHVSALPPGAQAVVAKLIKLTGAAPEAIDLVKFAQSKPRISLLSYPGFHTEGFPELAESWSVEVDTKKVSSRSYRDDANPPVLHRKELMVSDRHPQRAEFAALTAAAEAAGLLDDPDIIGHRLQWAEELRARGLAVRGHTLEPLAQAPTDAPSPDAPLVLRHRTALTRRVLSTPMQALWRHGYLDGSHAVFDYGCGRGDDLAAIAQTGLVGHGWDPYFRPTAPKLEADVVNLGFVLNVIEDLRERRDALLGAWGLTRTVLAVSALIGGRTAYEKYRLYQDGVLTTRGTFQKYFTHAELGEYIAATLGREPISVAPGLYFVFRDDGAEQQFLEHRQRLRYHAPSAPRPPATDRPKPERAPRTPRAPRDDRSRAMRRSRPDSRWERYADLIEAFWQTCLSLGRLPAPLEFKDEARLRDLVGTPKRTLEHLLAEHGSEALERARARRREDLLVFLALNLFERRKSFSALAAATQADIRDHFGSYAAATDEAKALLFTIASTEAVDAACTETAARGLGHLLPGDSLTLDTRLVNDLPALLRVYMGCAGKLYGEVESGDLVKIHISSGKLSVLTHDDYEGRLIPDLIERVKVDMRRQHVHYYQYGDEFPPQPLYMKSRFMTPDLEGYAEQREFDATLESLPDLDFSGYGPPREEVERALGCAHTQSRTPGNGDPSSSGLPRPPMTCGAQDLELA